MHWLRTIFSAVLPARAGQANDQTAPLPYPTTAGLTPPVCVIGDLHGRLDLLERMLDTITDRPNATEARLVFVGDMIDRGPNSAGVLRCLHRLSVQAPQTFICLMGNHERMMLDFLDDPLRNGPKWIAAGGAETLTSFGLSPWGRTAMPQLAVQLRDALTPAVEEWIRTLPLYWQDGHIAATHAGAAPDYGLDAQPAGRMLWGARGRTEESRHDGLCIVQGHDIVAQAGLYGNSIMVDTGAWCHGKLSAAWLDEKGLSIMEVSLAAR